MEDRDSTIHESRLGSDMYPTPKEPVVEVSTGSSGGHVFRWFRIQLQSFHRGLKDSAYAPFTTEPNEIERASRVNQERRAVRKSDPKIPRYLGLALGAIPYFAIPYLLGRGVVYIGQQVMRFRITPPPDKPVSSNVLRPIVRESQSYSSLSEVSDLTLSGDDFEYSRRNSLSSTAFPPDYPAPAPPLPQPSSSAAAPSTSSPKSDRRRAFRGMAKQNTLATLVSTQALTAAAFTPKREEEGNLLDFLNESAGMLPHIDELLLQWGSAPSPPPLTTTSPATSSSSAQRVGSERGSTLDPATRAGAERLPADDLSAFTRPLTNGQVGSSEQMVRDDVISMLVRSHEARILHLQQRIELLRESYRNSQTMPTNGLLQRQQERELTLMQHRLTLTQQNLIYAQQAQSERKIWVPTPSLRNKIADHGPEQAERMWLPALVNEEQVLVRDHDGRSLAIPSLRSGAITYYPHGEIDIEKLTQFEQDFNAVDSRTKIRKAEAKTLKKMVPALRGRKTREIKLMGRFAAGIELSKVLVQRQWALENQALQELTIHCQMLIESGKGLPKSGKLVVARQSALDGNKSAKSVGGFVNNEKNQILDMKAIYGLLEGKEILFDGTGPYLDEDGVIHLPIRLEGRQERVTFKPIFSNISVQGDIGNHGVQREINQKAMEGIKEEIEEKLGIRLIRREQPRGIGRKPKIVWEIEDIGLQEYIKSVEENMRTAPTEEEQQQYAEIIADLRQNGAQYRRIERAIAEQFINVDRKLRHDKVIPGKTNFSTAYEYGVLVDMLDISSTTSCFSGKDRTGVLIMMRTKAFIVKSIVRYRQEHELPPLTPAEIQQLDASLGRHLARPEGNLLKIIADNTGLDEVAAKVLSLEIFEGEGFEALKRLWTAAVTMQLNARNGRPHPTGY